MLADSKFENHNLQNKIATPKNAMPPQDGSRVVAHPNTYDSGDTMEDIAGLHMKTIVPKIILHASVSHLSHVGDQCLVSCDYLRLELLRQQVVPERVLNKSLLYSCHIRSLLLSTYPRSPPHHLLNF